jgi:predicted Zn-dependent protease
MTARTTQRAACQPGIMDCAASAPCHAITANMHPSGQHQGVKQAGKAQRTACATKQHLRQATVPWRISTRYSSAMYTTYTAATGN